MPEIRNLHVAASARGSGIGTMLIRSCEALVSGGTVEIGVAVDNWRARRLYERLGYVTTGRSCTDTYEYVDDSGAQRTATETSEIFAKQLA